MGDFTRGDIPVKVRQEAASHIPLLDQVTHRKFTAVVGLNEFVDVIVCKTKRRPRKLRTDKSG